MFDFVRTHNRLLQFLLALVIVPSFVVVGVQGYTRFMDGSVKTVATVDGADIKLNELDAAHRQQIERYTQQMPGADIKMFDTPEMKRQTLDGLVRERVLMVATVKDHLVVGDERLKRLFVTDPQYAAFRRPDGTVNAEMLAAQGMDSVTFAERLRQDYAFRQVLQGVAGSSVSGGGVAMAATNALLERRDAQLQRFDAKDYLAKVNPSDADIKAYYDAHGAQFKSPESASIEYTVLDIETLKKQASGLTDAKLREYYDQNASRYSVAEERRASHILISAAKDAPAQDRAKAKAKAEALLAEVRKAPASFADVAAKNSQDPGSASKGGDLDFFARGAMVKPFEEAAFAMKTGEISNVVESDFGYHIIKLVAVRGGDKKPFDAVRAEILEEVSKQQAQKEYAEKAEQFSNLVYEQSDTLQPAIDKLKLGKFTATVTRNPEPGAKGPLASPKLIKAVFSNDVLKNKRNTEAVETAPSQMVSARVVSYQPERVLPLEAVRDQVLVKVRAEQALAAARKDGQARMAAVRANGAEALPQALSVSRTLTQNQPRAIVEAILRADLAKGPAVVGVDLPDEGYAVVKVLKVLPADPANPDIARAKPYVERALADAETAAYYETLKKRFKVQVNAAALAPAVDAANAPAEGASKSDK
jgi:peptidyl-prolyl cis-trans isomerase D